MRYEIEGGILTDIADAIREKTGKSALITPEDMAEEIGDISGGGGGHAPDLSYLPNSTAVSVLESVDYTEYTDGDLMWGFCQVIGGTNTQQIKQLPAVTNNAVHTVVPIVFYMDELGGDVTVYGCMRQDASISSNLTMIAIPYTYSYGKVPNIFANANRVYTSIYGSDVQVSGLASTDYHVYAISIDATNKKAQFYIDGVFVRDIDYYNTGWMAVFSAASPAGTNQTDVHIKYIGVVGEFESDATIIANQQAIMTKLGLNT